MVWKARSSNCFILRDGGVDQHAHLPEAQRNAAPASNDGYQKALMSPRYTHVPPTQFITDPLLFFGFGRGCFKVADLKLRRQLVNQVTAKGQLGSVSTSSFTVLMSDRFENLGQVAFSVNFYLPLNSRTGSSNQRQAQYEYPRTCREEERPQKLVIQRAPPRAPKPEERLVVRFSIQLGQIFSISDDSRC